MPGTRALSPAEETAVTAAFELFPLRDQALIGLMLQAGRHNEGMRCPRPERWL